MRMIRKFLSDGSASTAVEYGILIAVLSLVIVAGIELLGDTIGEMFTEQGLELEEALRN